MTLRLRYSVRSHVGRVRDGNEDSAYAGSRLALVADGMGGHAAGEVASSAVVAALSQLDDDEAGLDLLEVLANAVQAANDHLRAMVDAEFVARRHGDDSYGDALLGHQARPRPCRRQSRLSAARRRVQPDHPRPDPRAAHGRRGSHHPRAGRDPPAAITAHPGARRPGGRAARSVGPRGPARRPLPAVQRRALGLRGRGRHRRDPRHS